MQVIPPGMEFHHIVPHDGDIDGETEESEDHQASPDPPIWAEVVLFFGLFSQLYCPFLLFVLSQSFFSNYKKAYF